jgi:hypothetical protein
MLKRRHHIALLGLVAGLLAVAVFAVPAQAALQIEEFETTTSSSLAGAHPDLHTHFKLKDAGAPEVAKNVTFNAPRGIFGNPSVLETCTSLDFALTQCPPNAQAGLITIHANYEGDPDFLLGTAPIYKVAPGTDEAARLAFIAPVLDIPVAIPVTVRSATDYGLRFTVSGITQLTPLASADLTFWGFPADPSHNEQRFPKGSPGHPSGCPEQADTSCSIPTVASTVILPFTGNPSVCGVPLQTSLDVETYQEPGVLSHADSSYPSITECERQTFQPGAQARLTTGEADSASGLDLVIRAPQPQSKAASPSQIRAAVLTFPEELTINPDAADGQSICSDVEAGIGTESLSHCPDNSKVGTISISSAALPGDLEGSIYFGQPAPGNKYRLFMIADGFGIHVKLIGKLLPNPQTGRLTAEFQDLPQLPFEEFDLHLFASDRGVFATPTHCAVYAVQTNLFPWNSVLADQRSQFGVNVEQGPGGKPCPALIRPFTPRLNAGTSNSKAGGFSSFTLKLDRDDGDQFLGDLNFTMPPGLTGSLRGIKYCPEAAIAAAAQNPGRTEQLAPSCPSSSAIGTTNVAAGPGSHPFHAYGTMYMAGPFKGAPLSLVAITPAIAGPYDYGVVVVRVAISVGSTDAHVIAVSDTVPSIIGGIPIRMRSIQVNLDRPNFIINPTNCSPLSVDSQGIGDQGTVAAFSSYFQAADCAPLPFAPKMAVKQIGARSETVRAKNPSMRFELKTRPGDANVKSVAVTLSKAFSIDQRHLGNLCSETELIATKCAGRQAIGTASAATPLLDEPLSGPVYAVSGKGGLPRLAFVLDGQVPLVPRAKSSSVAGGALKTVIPTVPDAPIGRFQLTLFGGKRGYLINTRSLCSAPVVSAIEYVAQNGKKLTQNVKAKAPCGGAGPKAKKRRGA